MNAPTDAYKHERWLADMERHCREAAELAEEYNWPEQAKAIRETGKVPEGFGREVGEAVRLFMQAPPLGGWVFIPF